MLKLVGAAAARREPFTSCVRIVSFIFMKNAWIVVLLAACGPSRPDTAGGGASETSSGQGMATRGGGSTQSDGGEGAGPAKMDLGSQTSGDSGTADDSAGTGEASVCLPEAIRGPNIGDPVGRLQGHEGCDGDILIEHAG